VLEVLVLKASQLLGLYVSVLTPFQVMWVDSVFGESLLPDWLKDACHQGSVIHVLYQLFVKFQKSPEWQS
jgi:hypothetical protein